MIQNASILVIPSEWQGFLLYVFLFFAIVFFPNGLRLPRRRRKFATTTRDVPAPPVIPPGSARVTALPPASAAATTAWKPRPQTAEIAPPPSVTDHTTQLLNKSEPEKR